MKATAILLLTGVLATPFVPVRGAPQDPAQDHPAQDPPKQDAPAPKKKKHPVTQFFEQETSRLMKETDGSWILIEYTDANQPQMGDAASGFATFHDGFLTLILGIQTVERHFLRMADHLVLTTGAYRYRFDEQGSLQLSSVMSVSNANTDSDLQREPSGQAIEYYAQLSDGLLQLRNSAGVLISFRKIEAGEFPNAAIQKIEGRRGGVPQWEKPQWEKEDLPK